MWPAATASSTCESPKPAPVTGTAWVGRVRPVTAALPLQSQRRPAERHRHHAGLRLHRRQSRLRDLLRRVLRVFRRLHPPDRASAVHADANRMEADNRRWCGSDQVPAPVVQGFWADTRNVILPTVPAPTLPVTNPRFIDSLPFSNYQSPGTGKLPRRMLQRRVARSERLQRGVFARQSLRRRAHHLQAGQHSSRLSRCSSRTAPRCSVSSG